ncbi:Uncharacterised protein [Mycobacteroides abscessus subsp. abscessus]|nr:Uncharacterised protein [Mycobacteroides abscessus subsp. abscessus]
MTLARRNSASAITTTPARAVATMVSTLNVSSYGQKSPCQVQCLW